MQSYRTTRRVKHSAAKMFDLVADVERYPQFVPMCESLHVRKRSGEADPLCQRLRKVAVNPSAQDNEACRAGHAFIDEMEKR